MKFFVYILESDINGSFYIGQTQNISTRLQYHNSGKNRSTKSKRPWKVIFTLEVSTRAEAMKIEKMIKSWKKRDAILKFIKENQ